MEILESIAVGGATIIIGVFVITAVAFGLMLCWLFRQSVFEEFFKK